jgi:fluoride exporter
MTILLISLGAAVGAPARYLTTVRFQARFGPSYPWATLTVNVVASLVLGVLVGAGPATNSHLTELIGTGFCGALSTYSAFSYETLLLDRGNGRGIAAGYVALTLVAGLGAAAAGWAVGSSFS